MDKISKELTPSIIKYVNKGVASFKLGKINDSIQSFKNATKENPNLNPTLVGRTEINPDDGRFRFIAITSESF